MPIVVRANNLEPGMCLASNVTNRFSVLLPHGHKLTQGDIEALKQRFPDKIVQVLDPLLDSIIEFDDFGQDHKISMEVRQNVSAVSQKVSSVVRRGTNLTANNIAGMQRTIEEMMQYMQDNPVTLALLEQSSNWDGYLQEHCANVFYLSMVMGNTMRNFIKRERERLSAARSIHNAMDLTALGTAAMLHDIGMIPVEKLYRKNDSLTPEEIKQVKAHPKEGSEMLPENIDGMVRLVIRCHHENQNGSGYPQGLAGDKITIFARILRVADAYSAAISDGVYKKAKSMVRALYEMIYGSSRHLYDPEVLKVFKGISQPFPIGARLKLQSGQIAVVTKHNHTDPFHPEVIIAFDDQGQSLPEDKCEGPFLLNEKEDIKVKSFEDEDISYINNIRDQEDTDVADESPSPVESELFDLVYP